MKVLKGLTCSEAELKKYFNEQKDLFHKVLLPRKTPDGYVIHLERLLWLLEAAYPPVLGRDFSVGVNVDATVMANRKTTSGSVRLIDEELEKKKIKINSARNEHFFALYYGGDDRFYLAENIFCNGCAGSLLYFLFNSFFGNIKTKSGIRRRGSNRNQRD